MRQILSCIDIGADFIKIVIGEYTDKRFHVLCAVKTASFGILNGKIIDREILINAVKECVSEAETKLGVALKKVILCSNLNSTKIIKNVCEIEIKSEDKVITGKDIADVIGKCSNGKIDVDYTILETVPVDFGINGDVITKDPKGLVSDNLAIKGIITEAYKDEVDCYIKILSDAGLKVIDVIPNIIGDYYNFKSMERDNETGAMVNIGYDSTTVSIYHKGYIIATKSIDIGVINIVEDIAYVKRLDLKVAKLLYDTFTIANSQLANTKNYRIVDDIDGEQVKIYQHELAEIAESRIVDMLELIKKQINILTKKEISYIIVLGGLTELKDFHLTISNIMGSIAKIGHINEIGARDNAYVSVIGVLKYFHGKLALRDRNFSIFADAELEEVSGTKSSSTKDSNLLNKVFGYFFDS